MINGLRNPRTATILPSDIGDQVEMGDKNVTPLRPGDEASGRRGQPTGQVAVPSDHQATAESPSGSGAESHPANR
jgi:hypothetical protein